MSRRAFPAPGKLLVSVIYRDEDRFALARERLVSLLGPMERESAPFPFDRTDYYAREMGSPLVRRFLVAAQDLPRERLSTIKACAWEIEGDLSRDGRRTVNIDPGLLTEENFVLATGKNYSHRVYLGDGVFADLALVFEKGGFRPLPWTYPDIASDPIRGFLADVRAAFREARKRGGERP